MNSNEDPQLSYECDRERELASLAARLAEVERRLRDEQDAHTDTQSELAEVKAAGYAGTLQARLAEAERLLRETRSLADIYPAEVDVFLGTANSAPAARHLTGQEREILNRALEASVTDVSACPVHRQSDPDCPACPPPPATVSGVK